MKRLICLFRGHHHTKGKIQYYTNPFGLKFRYLITYCSECNKELDVKSEYLGQ